jgi:hypothetical protein
MKRGTLINKNKKVELAPQQRCQQKREFHPIRRRRLVKIRKLVAEDLGEDLGEDREGKDNRNILYNGA